MPQSGAIDAWNQTDENFACIGLKFDLIVFSIPSHT